MRGFIMFLMLLGGVGVLLYPDLLNWQESQQHIGFIQQYNENIALMAQAELDYQFERARIFNLSITDISMNDPWGQGASDVSGTAEYYSMLDFNHTNNMMARIEIPAINVDLPVFHGSTSAVLDRGVGHMPHTSLPIGGYGNHSVLTAHTGLIRSRLFTDLVDLPVGQIFVITVGDRRLAYQVYQRQIVWPHQIDVLQTEEDRDLVTLVTCYPYGINSHRLLVFGERIEYEEGMVELIEPIIDAWELRHLAVIALVALVILISIFRGIKAKKKKKRRQKNMGKILDRRFDREYEELFGVNYDEYEDE